eukprot:scpid88709/ scgid11672/ Cyclin-dependent kinase 1; Cell division control protein 2 homolog; Cell division protein kinase 1; p34 protein kinase
MVVGTSEDNYKSISNGKVTYNITDVILGHGVVNTVYAATRLHDQRFVAAKIPKIRTADYEKEINVLALLCDAGKHPNIVELIDIVAHESLSSHQRSDNLYIILEYMHINLVRWLNTRGCGHFLPETVKMEISVQLYSGLAFLNAANIRHNSLDYSHILVDVFSGTFKISDFGQCTIVSGDTDEKKLDNCIDSAVKDLRYMTSWVIVPLWLCRHYADVECCPELDLDTIDSTLEDARNLVFSYTDNYYEVSGSMGTLLREEPNFWESKDEDDMRLKEMILWVHGLNCSRPQAGGDAIPERVVDILAIGLLYTELYKATAASIVHKMSLIHPPLTRFYARQFVTGNDITSCGN